MSEAVFSVFKSRNSCFFRRIGLLSNFLWNTTGITLLSSSQVSLCSGLYIDPYDDLYIVDEQGNQVIAKLANNTSTLVRIAGLFQSSGPNASQFRNPQDVYFDSNQNLYVSDLNNQRIQKFVSGSTIGVTIVGSTGSGGSAVNQLSGSRYFNFDPTETYMYIADQSNHRIIRFLTSSSSGDNGTIMAGGNGPGIANN